MLLAPTLVLDPRCPAMLRQDATACRRRAAWFRAGGDARTAALYDGEADRLEGRLTELPVDDGWETVYPGDATCAHDFRFEPVRHPDGDTTLTRACVCGRQDELFLQNDLAECRS